MKRALSLKSHILTVQVGNLKHHQKSAIPVNQVKLILIDFKVV